MEKRFKRDINTLPDVFDFIDQFAASDGIDGSVILTMKFVAEELFTNLVKYNISDDQSDIAISLELAGPRFIMRLIDFGVEPFDVTAAPDFDTTLPLEQRKPGGLGLHLVKKMVTDIQYEYKDRKSTITVTKNLE